MSAEIYMYIICENSLGEQRRSRVSYYYYGNISF